MRGKVDYKTIVYDAASNNSKNNIELIQNMALRNIVGTRWGTLKEAVDVAFEIATLNIRRQQLTLNYWLKRHRTPNIQLSMPLMRTKIESKP